ncbi:MAG: DUF4111 domain-containing protein [Actinobacteria bacterium]|nr:DUF4111 domain-containing protein [Actinomycetota bacterium]
MPWGVFGVCRLHATLATGEIVSKEAAGEYALDAFAPEWHPPVREALANWRGRASPRKPVPRRRGPVAGFVDLAVADVERLGPGPTGGGVGGDDEPTGGAGPARRRGSPSGGSFRARHLRMAPPGPDVRAHRGTRAKPPGVSYQFLEDRARGPWAVGEKWRSGGRVFETAPPGPPKGARAGAH